MNCIKAFLHKHPAGIFVVLVLGAAIALVWGVGQADKSQTAVVVLGGVIGAWLNILDVLSDHRSLKIKASGLKPVTWHDVFYLSGRTILGGMSGLVVFNVWGIAGSASASEFTRLLSLGIVAGFSTTTLAKLSKTQTEHDGDA